MSWLDSFCISYFDEQDNFIRVTEKGLLLNKAHFTEKGYRIDEQIFSHNSNEASSSSGKGK